MKVTRFRVIFWPAFAAFAAFLADTIGTDTITVPILTGSAVGSALFLLLSLVCEQTISRLMALAIVIATVSFFIFLLTFQ
jgi:hypothetical protein